jgi:hypothetical protein
MEKMIKDLILDLITIKHGYPPGSRGYEALDWAIKNLMEKDWEKPL